MRKTLGPTSYLATLDQKETSGLCSDPIGSPQSSLQRPGNQTLVKFHQICPQPNKVLISEANSNFLKNLGFRLNQSWLAGANI